MKKFSTLLVFGLISTNSLALNFRNFNSSIKLLIRKADQQIYVCSSVAISPSTIVTAAHCLDDALEVSAELDEKKLSSYQWEIHPKYNRLVSNYRYDIGILYLENPLPSALNYPKISEPKGRYSLERIGFGNRDGENKLTHISGIQIESVMDKTIKLKDKLGVPGDSGGPIFQRVGGSLYLVGIHSTVQTPYSFAPRVSSLLRY